jgi:hypothetical protein
VFEFGIQLDCLLHTHIWPLVLPNSDLHKFWLAWYLPER